MLDELCKVITVERTALPQDHDFVIVVQENDRTVVFAAPDDAAQLEARAAYLAWDRHRELVSGIGLFN